ncbi:integral membrane protein [Hypoxylon sp. FL1150]|nr:integral membrane protein [Hypoxylon sp. FL1150]
MGFTSIHYGLAAPDEQPYHNRTEMLRFLSANQLCLYIGAGLVKIAVALVLYRIASTKRLKGILVGSIGVVIVWTVAMTTLASGPCASGGASNWAGSKTCERIGYFRTISNIFIDWFYSLLPIWMLWNVHMDMRMKISVMLLLGLGFFASSATFVKLYVIVRLVKATGAEAADLHNDLLLWADIELGMAIFAVAAAGIRPLLSKYVPAIWGRSTPTPTPTPGSHGVTSSEAAGPYSALGTSSEMMPVHSKDRTHGGSESEAVAAVV